MAVLPVSRLFHSIRTAQCDYTEATYNVEDSAHVYLEDEDETEVSDDIQ